MSKGITKHKWLLILALMGCILQGIICALPEVSSAMDAVQLKQRQASALSGWRDFQNRHPRQNWKISWDKKRLTPRKITGGSIASTVFDMEKVTKHNVDQWVRSFVDRHRSLFNIEFSTLKRRKLRFNRSLKTVSYLQTYDGVAVYNSRIILAFKNNRLVMFKSHHHPDISMSTAPALTDEDALSIAQRRYPAIQNKPLANAPELIILPDENDDNPTLTYRVGLPMMENPDALQRDQKPYIHPVLFIDARTGRIVKQIDTLRYGHLTGAVTGFIYPAFSDETQISMPISNQWLSLDGRQVTTDANGRYDIETDRSSAMLTATLEGPWAKVINLQQDTAYHSHTVTIPGVHNWTWADADNSYKHNDPCSGKYYSGAWRCVDTLERYPDVYAPEPHSGMGIISGALWDMRKQLGAEMVDGFAVDALRMGPVAFSELVEHILIADDDNGDLSDGTPHIDPICHAFWDLHGVFNEYCMHHTQTAVAEIVSPAPKQQTIFGRGRVEIMGTALGTIDQPLTDYTIAYEPADTPGVWSDEAITLTGGSVNNDVLGVIDLDRMAQGRFTLKLTANYGNETYESYPVPFIIDSSVKTGWPLRTDRQLYASPVLADLDGNGADDILLASYGNFYALNGNGTHLAGWPVRTQGYCYAKAAVGDIDGGRDVEVVTIEAGRTVQAFQHVHVQGVILLNPA